MRTRVALALVACLALVGCDVFRPHSEVTPEAAGRMVSLSGQAGEPQTFELDTGMSVTINPGRLDVLQAPNQSYANTGLVLWGHHDSGREWIIATDPPVEVPGVPGDCYRVLMLGRPAGADVVFHTAVGPFASATILEVRVKRAPNSSGLTAGPNGEYPEKFFCLSARGEVTGQP